MFGNFQKRVQDWYGQLKINAGSTKQPALEIAQTWNDAATTFTGIKANITDTASASVSNLVDLQVGGISRFSMMAKSGNANGAVTEIKLKASGTSDHWARLRNYHAASSRFWLILDSEDTDCANSVQIRLSPDLPTMQFRSDLQLGWRAVTTMPSSAPDMDTILLRDAADTLAQRRTTTAQTFRLYNTWTDASNYERIAFTWDSNTAKIQTEAAGTGVLRNLQISGLPSTDPNVSGVLWNSNNTVRVSTGAGVDPGTLAQLHAVALCF